MKSIRATGAKIIGTTSLLLLTLLLLPAALLFANGQFQDSGQALGGDTSYDVALADLDGDGDLDAFSANGLGNRAWINQGGAQGGSAAVFQNSGGSPGLLTSRGIALADLDDNQTVDAFMANNGENETWLNDGNANFSLKQQIFSNTADSQDVALAQLNKDKFPDAFITNNGANEVWFNNGDGTFSAAQVDLGSANSHEVALGDVNNDGAIDAYVANGTTSSLADKLWINNGQGKFTASNQDLDLDWNDGVALGDLDTDGDLDVFLATWFGSDSVWINQGGLQGGEAGQFKDSGQALSGNGSTDVSLVDVDGDNQLDAIVAKFTGTPSEVWLNNGKGQFSNSGQKLDDAATYQIAAGDLDLDGDSDIFFANFGPNHVWLMSGFGLPKAWFDVDARSNPNGIPVYPWAQPGDAKLPVILDFAAPEDLIITAQIESDSGIKMKTVPFGAGTTSGQLSVENPSPLLTETLTLTLSTDAALSKWDSWLHSLQREGSTTAKVNPLKLLFIDEQKGPTSCFLCMLDWVLKLADFEPSFWQLHHVQLADLRASPSWSYYMGLFQAHESELTTILLTNPGLLWETFDVLQVWTPGIVAADAGQGDTIIITQAQAGEVEDLLKDIAEAASPQLKEAIKYETQILDFPSQGGKNMNQALEKLKSRVKGQIYLPSILKN